VVSAKGQSQLRRSTEDSLENTEELLGEDMVIPMIPMIPMIQVNACL
jgi:hypothetical protein